MSQQNEEIIQNLEKLDEVFTQSKYIELDQIKMKINDLFSVNSDLFISEFMSFIKNEKYTDQQRIHALIFLRWLEEDIRAENQQNKLLSIIEKLPEAIYAEKRTIVKFKMSSIYGYLMAIKQEDIDKEKEENSDFDSENEEQDIDQTDLFIEIKELLYDSDKQKIILGLQVLNEVILHYPDLLCKQQENVDMILKNFMKSEDSEIALNTLFILPNYFSQFEDEYDFGKNLLQEYCQNLIVQSKKILEKDSKNYEYEISRLFCEISESYHEMFKSNVVEVFNICMSLVEDTGYQGIVLENYQAKFYFFQCITQIICQDGKYPSQRNDKGLKRYIKTIFKLLQMNQGELDDKWYKFENEVQFTSFQNDDKFGFQKWVLDEIVGNVLQCVSEQKEKFLDYVYSTIQDYIQDGDELKQFTGLLVISKLGITLGELCDINSEKYNFVSYIMDFLDYDIPLLQYGACLAIEQIAEEVQELKKDFSKNLIPKLMKLLEFSDNKAKNSPRVVAAAFSAILALFSDEETELDDQTNMDLLKENQTKLIEACLFHLQNCPQGVGHHIIELLNTVGERLKKDFSKELVDQIIETLIEKVYFKENASKESKGLIIDCLTTYINKKICGTEHMSKVFEMLNDVEEGSMELHDCKRTGQLFGWWRFIDYNCDEGQEDVIHQHIAENFEKYSKNMMILIEHSIKCSSYSVRFQESEALEEIHCKEKDEDMHIFTMRYQSPMYRAEDQLDDTVHFIWKLFINYSEQCTLQHMEKGISFLRQIGQLITQDEDVMEAQDTLASAMQDLVKHYLLMKGYSCKVLKDTFTPFVNSFIHNQSLLDKQRANLMKVVGFGLSECTKDKIEDNIILEKSLYKKFVEECEMFYDDQLEQYVEKKKEIEDLKNKKMKKHGNQNVDEEEDDEESDLMMLQEEQSQVFDFSENFSLVIEVAYKLFGGFDKYYEKVIKDYLPINFRDDEDYNLISQGLQMLCDIIENISIENIGDQNWAQLYGYVQKYIHFNDAGVIQNCAYALTFFVQKSDRIKFKDEIKKNLDILVDKMGELDIGDNSEDLGEDINFAIDNIKASVLKLLYYSYMISEEDLTFEESNDLDEYLRVFLTLENLKIDSDEASDLIGILNNLLVGKNKVILESKVSVFKNMYKYYFQENFFDQLSKRRVANVCLLLYEDNVESGFEGISELNEEQLQFLRYIKKQYNDKELK